MSERNPRRLPETATEPPLNPESGDNLLATEKTLIKPADSKLLIVAGPWTPQARWDAAKAEVRSATERYFSGAMKKRNWTPWDDLPLDEMRDRGQLLSDDTITIVQAYLGVEDFVGDYVQDGLNLIGKERERRNAHLVWGMEEAKHAEAWERVLLHSGRRTAKELREYRDEVGSHTWRMRDDHPGLDTPLGVIAYAMLQERATYFNYEETRKRIRQEYGLPERATREERERGMETGAAGAFKTVGVDEIAHHGFFLELAKIYTRYVPEQMLDAMAKVFGGFHMPALNLVKNHVDIEGAMRRTEIHTPKKQVHEVNNPVLEALGFDTEKPGQARRALEKAAQQAKILPDNLGPQYIGISKTGEFVLATEPDPRVEESSPTSGVLFERDAK